MLNNIITTLLCKYWYRLKLTVQCFWKIFITFTLTQKSMFRKYIKRVGNNGIIYNNNKIYTFVLRHKKWNLVLGYHFLRYTVKSAKAQLNLKWSFLLVWIIIIVLRKIRNTIRPAFQINTTKFKNLATTKKP